jgi:hypothetical protein
MLSRSKIESDYGGRDGSGQHRHGTRLRIATSPAVDFVVAPKLVVESRRVLPVAFGIPLLLGLGIMLRRWRVR